jgi:dinuclear metal center YbgI/SA1388 family protein
MTTVADLCRFLDAFAPPALAEDWDNVGLLVGDRGRPVERVMTCLTITPASVAEAIERRAEANVTHHPLPFKPLQRLTTDSTPGRLLLDLIEAKIAVYSPHTAFDSAAAGINQQLAAGIGLVDILPLVPARSSESTGEGALGAGRCGRWAQAKPLREIAAQLKQFLQIDGLHVVGNLDAAISIAAVACGSAGSFLEPASACGCQLLVTGETNFHTCLAAEASGVALLLPGHYASERFAVERLVAVLAEQFPTLTIWASQREADPLRWL